MSKKQYQEYSQLSVAIDLISEVYKTSNPVIISEKLEEDLALMDEPNLQNHVVKHIINRKKTGDNSLASS